MKYFIFIINRGKNMEQSLTFKNNNDAISCLLWLHNAAGFYVDRNKLTITFPLGIPDEDFAELKKRYRHLISTGE